MADLSYIIEPLRPLAVPIADLVPDKENARKHGPENLRAIRASLESNGQYLPIVVQQEGMIVRVGNGRMSQAIELGWTHLAAVVVPMSRVEAVRIALADNRTGDLAEWDYEQLKTLLVEFDVQEFSAFWDERELSMFMDATFTPPSQSELPSPPGSGSGSGGSADPSTDAEPRAINFEPAEYEQLKQAATRVGIESLPEFIMWLLNGVED